MAWTYDPDDLATNEVYQIRAELQDTDPQDQLLDDEEIAYALTLERNFWSAAARCAEMIGRRYMRKADVRLGRSLMVTYTKMAKQWLEMAKSLRAKSLGTVVPYIGGMNIADKVALAGDTSLVAPLFTKTMMENPYTGGYDTDSLPAVASGNVMSPVIDEDL